MAIVKIFPEDQNRSDFSIRLIAERYHVYEGDKLLRTNLISIDGAVKEIDEIIDLRLKTKLTSIKVSHQGFEAEEKTISPYKRKHTFTPMKCANCGDEFNSIRSNHLTCSRLCSSIVSNSKHRQAKVEATASDIIMETPADLRGFEELTKKSISDKKRDNYFKDLISIIIGNRNFAVEMERKWDFDEFYKNLLRLNLVYYNNVNIFTLMPSLMKVDEYGKHVPVANELWVDPRNQQSAVTKVLQTMIQMDTYPTHQQQNSLSSFNVVKQLFDDVVSLNCKVETLLSKIQSMNKTLRTLETRISKPTNSDEKSNGGKKSWFNF